MDSSYLWKLYLRPLSILYSHVLNRFDSQTSNFFDLLKQCMIQHKSTLTDGESTLIFALFFLFGTVTTFFPDWIVCCPLFGDLLIEFKNKLKNELIRRASVIPRVASLMHRFCVCSFSLHIFAIPASELFCHYAVVKHSPIQ